MGSSTIKIGFSYIAYPVAMPRYMLEALLRRDDVEVWVAGPYTGRQIPWLGGMFLPAEYTREPNYSVPMSMPPTINYDAINGMLPFTPDIWIEGNAGLQTIGRPNAGVYVVIGTDPHVLDYSKARASADIFYAMQRPYMKPGDRWLPYGFDPVIHRKTEKPWEEREHGISLVGLPYPDRKAFMNQIRARGYTAFMENGPAYEDAWAIYNNSKLGLNLSSRQDTCARVFELLGMGLPAVLNLVPDLTDMFNDGEDFVGFRGVQDGVNKAIELLEDPVRAQAIAESGHAAVQDHTWDERMEQVLIEAEVLT